MKRTFPEQIRLWAGPVLTCLLGAALLLRPGSFTATLAKAIGMIIALAGAWRLIHALLVRKAGRDLLSLSGGLVLLLLGLSIVNNPVGLERRVGRIIGILLLLRGIRGLIGPIPTKSRVSSGVLCTVGVLLLLVPVAASRLVISGCGVAVLLVGIGMVPEILRGTRTDGSDIIDAR